MNISKFNAEGYHDPTAYEALTNWAREEKRKTRYHRPTDAATTYKQNGYPRTYICSPFSGDTKGNIMNAIRYCRYALERERFPIAPHLFLPRFMDDDNHAERGLALSFGLRLLSGCREIWVFGGRVSGGMADEIAEAKRRGIPIRYYTNECKEVLTNGGKEK